MDKEIRDTGRHHHDVSQVVETRYAANLILRRQRHIVEEMQHHGELTDGDAANLTAEINAKLKEIHFSHPDKFGVKEDHDVLLPCLKFLKPAIEGADVAEAYKADAQKLLQLLLERKTVRHFGVSDVVLTSSTPRASAPSAAVTTPAGSGARSPAGRQHRRQARQAGRE